MRTKAHVRFDTEDTEGLYCKTVFYFYIINIFWGRRWLRLFPVPVNIWDNNEADETNCLETSRSASKSAECSGYCTLVEFFLWFINLQYLLGRVGSPMLFRNQMSLPGRGKYYRVSQIEKNSNKWLSSGTTTTTLSSPPGQPPTLIITPSTATREISASTARREK